MSHFLHHQYTVHRGLDKEVILGPVRITWLDFLMWFTFDYKWFKMIMFPLVAHAFGNGDADPFFWDPLFEKGDERRRRMIRWDRLVLAVNVILLALFIYSRQWIFIGTVTFGYFFGTFMAWGCVFQQHSGMRPNVPDWRLNSHTALFGPVLRFFYWNMNYHIEHHMYAAVPFYNMKKLHDAIKHDLPDPPKGFLRGFRFVLDIQRKQKTDPDYVYIPEFPETAAPPREK